MTTRLSDAYGKLANAYEGLAVAYEALGVAAAQVALASGDDRKPSTRPQDAPGAPSFEELPFDDPGPLPVTGDKPAVCPTHGLPWSIREAGTSKATGQPYNAFWKCDAQNAEGSYCKQKPTPAWVKAHPAR